MTSNFSVKMSAGRSWQCDVRVIVVFIVSDNTLLSRLWVLHPKKFWIFCPIEKNSMLPHEGSRAKTGIVKKLYKTQICFRETFQTDD